MSLHPDFPVVSGNYLLNEDWALTLPDEFNRRLEDQDLVLWRPGFTIWMSLWNNDHGEAIGERLAWIREDVSGDAFELELDADSDPGRLVYRLNERREQNLVYALYGFVVKSDGHLQIAIYMDDEDDIVVAQGIFASIR